MRKFVALILLASVNLPAFACLDASSGSAKIDRIEISPDQIEFTLSADGNKLVARLTGTYALARFSYASQCSGWWSGPSLSDRAANHRAAAAALSSQPEDAWAHLDPQRAFVDRKLTLVKAGLFNPSVPVEGPTDVMAQCLNAQLAARTQGKSLVILRQGYLVGMPSCEVAR